jgi:UDP:flavonoid glycosyltransferase YjiC (YdhE family)
MRILYGVSSVGLGHARRSLTLADCLRKARSDLEIDWITSEPVISFLEKSGEKVLPISRKLRSLSPAMENGVHAGRLDDMAQVARNSSSVAKENYFLLKDQLVNYPVLIQDEFSETLFSFMWDSHTAIPSKRVVITDYVQFQSRAAFDPLSKLTLWYANRMLIKAFDKSSLRILADDLESVPSALRGKVTISFAIVGPILPKSSVESKTELKKNVLKNFWSSSEVSKQLVVVSIGGTSVGKYLIDFLYKNSEEITRNLDCLILVLLGPRIDPANYETISKGALRFVPFIPNILELFKAADCVVSQAGASTLNEVASVRTPCVIFPIENHFEQEANAKRFSEKYGFVVLKYSELTPKTLVDSVKQSLQTAIIQEHFDGAEKATDQILRLISEEWN